MYTGSAQYSKEFIEKIFYITNKFANTIMSYLSRLLWTKICVSDVQLFIQNEFSLKKKKKKSKILK